MARSLYKCGTCRKLMHGPPNAHGERCPRCDTGTLRVITKPRRRDLEEHERAEGM